jgi:hypothetical protein
LQSLSGLQRVGSRAEANITLSRASAFGVTFDDISLAPRRPATTFFGGRFQAFTPILKKLARLIEI